MSQCLCVRACVCEHACACVCVCGSVCSHIQSLVGPLEGPGEGDGGVAGHDVSVGLPLLAALPGLHHRGALPVHILQGAPESIKPHRDTCIPFGLF